MVLCCLAVTICGCKECYCMLTPSSYHSTIFNVILIRSSFSFSATGFKSQEEPISETTRDKNHPPHSRIDTRLPSSPIAPPISLPGPPMMPGPRPNMPPMPRPHGIPNPHLPPFFSPQNRPHMPPRVLPGGPMFAADRFRMPPAFSPPGPPFQRFPPMRPEQRFFQNASPGFGPPFPSGRWRWTWTF